MEGNLKMFTNYSGHAMQWCIFLMQSEVAVVPMVWVENRELCKWRPFKTDSRVQRAVKDGIKPEVSWESFKINILYE